MPYLYFQCVLTTNIEVYDHQQTQQLIVQRTYQGSHYDNRLQSTCPAVDLTHLIYTNL